MERIQREHEFKWADGATDSNEVELGGGAFGSLIVPSGSDLIGKTLQFVAVSNGTTNFAATTMLSTGKTLAAGSNALTNDEIAEVGSVGRCKLRLNSAVSGAASAALLWKS